MSGETAPAAPSARTAARWIAGFLMIFYGFSKVTGAQFLVLDSELARPMGEVDRFWLTWYYFGVSTTYKYFIASAEIGGGLLLLWPRTALAGALMLLPVTINIIVIDFLFHVLIDAQIVAWVVLICLLNIILPHLPRLKEAVLGAPAAPARISRWARLAIATGIMTFAAGMGWFIRHHTIRAPTPIDGIWGVVADQGGDSTRIHWRQAFFELNRAHMLILRAPGEKDAEHHFEIDSAGRVRIWEEWLTKGALIGEGALDRDGKMELTFTPAAGGGHLALERTPLRQ